MIKNPIVKVLVKLILLAGAGWLFFIGLIQPIVNYALSEPIGVTLRQSIAFCIVGLVLIVIAFLLIGRDIKF